MHESVPRYASGEDIRIADRISLAGRPGRIAFVIDTRSFSAEYPEKEWSYLGRGFMIDAAGYGLVHLEAADEDLVLVERA